MRSESFKLSDNMIALLEKHGITAATPIQKAIIPAIMAGNDILAQSETGSGKTISFAVPIIETIKPEHGLSVLVLVPTRELCVQITKEFVKFSLDHRRNVTSVYGGVSMQNQIHKLRRTSIVVATPGRLLDLLNRKAIDLKDIRFLVFDEADRMLDMGFVRDIEKILKRMPQKKQTMLFSATVTKDIEKLSKKYLTNPVHVSMESAIKPEFLRQVYYQTSTANKLPALISLLKKERDLALVFCNMKHSTSKLAKKLIENGVHAKCLHGDLTQNQRERVTEDFRNRRFNVLIATDVASRGLHIEGITHVYNYEIPRDVESYTHRVGRTARAGKKGEAISLVSGGEDSKFFKNILFNYTGTITLKTFDGKDAVLSAVKHEEEAPKNKKKPPFRRKDRKDNKDQNTAKRGWRNR